MKIITNFISIFFFCLVIITFSACKKPKRITIPEDNTPKSVTGKWRWLFTVLNYPDPATGGPAKLTPLNTGETQGMEFFNENQWKKILNNAIIDSGTYYLEHGTYVNPSNSKYVYDQLNYNRNGSILGADWYEIHRDTLIFNYYCPTNI